MTDLGDGAAPGAAALLAEIEDDRERYLRLARRNYAGVQVFFWVGALLSAIAAAWGLFELYGGAKVAGGLAGLSTLVALTGRQAGLQQKANWHYRKVDQLKAMSPPCVMARSLPPRPRSTRSWLV